MIVTVLLRDDRVVVACLSNIYRISEVRRLGKHLELRDYQMWVSQYCCNVMEFIHPFQSTIELPLYLRRLSMSYCMEKTYDLGATRCDVVNPW